MGVFNRVRRKTPRGRLLRSRLGAWRSRSSRSTTPPQGAHKVGGSRKAPSVSTWLIIQDKSLRVGDLVDSGWGLQPEREQGPLWTLVGLRQHHAATGYKQEQR